MSRGEFLREIPLATFATIVLCCCVYIYQLVADPPLHHYTICPRLVLHLNEYYRLVTSTLFHGGIMHIGMNMISTAAIGSFLEQRLGTLRQAFTILWAILLTSSTYTLVAYALHLVLGFDQLMYGHALGFSGVLFHLCVLEANLTTQRSRSVAGMFNVPTQAYPWALLILLKFIMPETSLLGHLAGILTGTLQSYGVLDGIMVSDSYLKEMESWNILSSLTKRQGFIETPNNVMDGGSGPRRDPAALRGAVCRGVMAGVKFIRDVLETLKVAIFGYGRDANSNIHLGRPSSTTGSVAGSMASELDIDEDDWVGLPSISKSETDAEARLV